MSHRSQVVWNTRDCNVLRVKRATQGSLADIHDLDVIPLDLQEHLLRAGFWHVCRMKRPPVCFKILYVINYMHKLVFVHDTDNIGPLHISGLLLCWRR